MTPLGLFSGGLKFSAGSMSTTMQVVPSLNPFEVKTSYITRPVNTSKKKTRPMNTDKTINHALLTRDTPGMKIGRSTLTI